jgi:hypothetical protein
MPLLMVVRSSTPHVRKIMLEKLPIPMMVMLRNRMTNGPQDNLAKKVAEEVKVAMTERAKKGETVVVNQASAKERTAGVTTVGGSVSTPQAPAAPRSVPAPPKPAAAPPPPKAAPRPAERPAAQAAPAAAPPPPQGILNSRLVVAWRMNGAALEVRTISAREIASLVGREAQVLVPWVMIAYQTGQVFLPPPPVTPTLGEKLVGAVMKLIPENLKPRLAAPQVQQLSGQAKSLSHQKFLLALISKAVAADAAKDAGAMQAPLATLTGKFGSNLTDFLRNPSKDDYRDLRVNLSADEKSAVSVLQKVARLQ